VFHGIKNDAFTTLKTIVTPHPKELERLIGPWESEEEQFEKTIAFQNI
jgi:NAD(P)H-hydrate repair Nnr-like enzyme with NAD(P)H-hydrate dehydratase domain